MPNVWSNLVHIFWAKIGVLATFKIQGIFGRTLCTHAVINVCWTSAHSYFTSRYFHRKYLCDDIVHTVLAVLGPMGVYMPLKIAGTIWKFYFIKSLGLFECRNWRNFKSFFGNVILQRILPHYGSRYYYSSVLIACMLQFAGLATWLLSSIAPLWSPSVGAVEQRLKFSLD